MAKRMIPDHEIQKLRTPDFVRLFWYAKRMSRLVGQKNALGLLEEFVIKKRLAWLNENETKIKSVKGSPIERAFKIFYKMNQKLDFKDAVVVRRDKDIIITRWFNYCPVLEACKITGLNTKDICKKIYHKPNQIFLSKIHPRLKFRRNYKAIRPYTDYCEEIIEFKR
jgi:hypothetical protein